MALGARVVRTAIVAMDPVGALPLFVAWTSGRAAQERGRQLRNGLLTALAFAWCYARRPLAPECPQWWGSRLPGRGWPGIARAGSKRGRSRSARQFRQAGRWRRPDRNTTPGGPSNSGYAPHPGGPLWDRARAGCHSRVRAHRVSGRVQSSKPLAFGNSELIREASGS